MEFLALRKLTAQNVGIGTNTPAAKPHMNGDLLLQNGNAVSKFKRDSLFSKNSHNNVPAVKAMIILITIKLMK